MESDIIKHQTLSDIIIRLAALIYYYSRYRYFLSQQQTLSDSALTAMFKQQVIDLCLQKCGFAPHEPQLNCFNSIASNCDTIYCAPTGHGKSLLYQLSTPIRQMLHHQNTRTLVITPLNSLINTSLHKIKTLPLNCSSAVLTSDTGYEALVRTDIILTTPESLMETAVGRQLLNSNQWTSSIGTVFIDECHVIKSYAGTGDRPTFRQAYSRLGELRTFLPSVPIVCMTATATTSTIQHISNSLGLLNPALHMVREAKTNISYHLERVNNDFPFNFDWLVGRLRDGNMDGKTLLFFQNRFQMGVLYDYITANINQSPSADRPKVMMYHSDTDQGKKDEAIMRLTSHSSDTTVVICSSSLSLGLDFTKLTRVIHYGIPHSIEDYIQETGRAARETGSEGVAILLHYSSMTAGRSVEKSMKDYIDIGGCRRQFLMHHFGIDIESNDHCCDNCNYVFDEQLQEFLDCIHSQGGATDDQTDQLENSSSESDSDPVQSPVWSSDNS